MITDSFFKTWDGVREHCDGWECITYGECLDAWANRYGERIAIVYVEESASYRTIHRYAHNLTGYYLEHGLKKGDHVLFSLGNSLVYLPALFGLYRMGVIPVMTLPSHGRMELEAIGNLVQPTGLFFSDSVYNPENRLFAEEMKEICPSIQVIFEEDDLKREMQTDRKYNLSDRPDYRDIAMLTLSGGTSGIPKLIPRTHGDYIYNNKVIAERCRVSMDDVYLSVLPAQHNFTLGNPGILGTLQKGGRVVLCESPSPVDIVDAVEREKVTFTALVPSVLETLLEYRKIAQEEDLSSLRYIMVGGAMLPRETAACCKPVLGCELLQIYGTSEGLNCCHFPDDPEEIRLKTQGPPISEYDAIRVVDEEGRDLPLGTPGEMLTKGPYTITEYYRNPKANASSFTADGWYRTGDRVVLNERREIRIVGRTKEQINRGGEKIIPEEIEEAIRRMAGVLDCAVCGVDDTLYGQKTAAFVAGGEKTVTRDSLRAFLRELGMAEYKLPDYVIPIGGIPLTPIGKPDKKRLVKEWKGNGA